MWKVYCDNYVLYNPELDDYKLFDPTLSLELNKTGRFTFKIYSNHPNYDKLNKLKSVITVYQDDGLYFRGRILNDVVGWYNERQVTCEGELAFLLDTIQRPFEFPISEGDTATPEAYLTFLIDRHNLQVEAARQFVMGTVTVTDENNYISRSDTEYSTTWDLINEGLLSTHGGYLWIDADSNGNRRINYYSDFDILSNQKIELGKNLLNLSNTRKGEDVATAIIPLGKKDETTEQRLTISDLPDEDTTDICKTGDYVYSKAAVLQYGGLIFKTVTFDDVSVASNLLTKAKSTLSDAILQAQTIDLTSADLSAAGYDYNSFKIGTYVTAKSAVHSLSDNYLVKKLSIKLLSPSQNQLTLGATVYSFTEENRIKQETQWKEVQTNVEASQNKAIKELEQRTNSSILQHSEEILSRVSSDYYTRQETDQRVSSVSTELSQQADAFELRFNSITQNIESVSSGADASFEEIRKYIRFTDGNIILGEDGNQQTQVITSTQNQFKEGSVVVAYIGNRKMYITDGEFTNSLKLGNFAFIPRNNGNLSFKKVSG